MMLASLGEMADASRGPGAVIIVGAGPAGMSLALGLEERGIASLLVEAGGLEFAGGAAIDPYQGDASPRPYPLSSSRLRFFGGTSGHWGGWCRPLDPVDFLPIPGVPYSGWPISRDEAYCELAAAHRLLEIEDGDYDSEEVLALAGERLLAPGRGSGFRSVAYRFSPPTRFGERYRQRVADSRLVHCSLNTRLLRIERDADGRSTLVLADAAGTTRRLRAGAHVLALGGIENARVLLWSNRGLARPFGGDGDWLGRGFADHVRLPAAQVLAARGLDYGQRSSKRGVMMGRTCPDPRRVAAGETTNHVLSLTPSSDAATLQPEYGGNASVFGTQGARLQLYDVLAVTGQRPNRDSRIRLSDDVDVDGVARVRLDWRLHESDWLAVRDSVETLGQELAASGRGRLRRRMLTAPGGAEALSTGMHHVGTTRMAADAASGVVDADGRVFGSEDLYVVGSSVFPTMGYANPTLTLVALALRLAATLPGRLAERAS